MADTARTLAQLQALFPDNNNREVSAQDLRDFLVSTYQPQAINGFRLTLESGVPVSTSDQSGKTNIYLTPYLHNCIGVYDGSSWKQYTSSELTLALGTLTSGKPYDVFIYDNAGTLTLEATSWNTDTARTTNITLQDGVYCKSGALSRRYLGTFYTSATTTTEDTATKRYLWNMYNRVPRTLLVTDTTNSWTYTSTTPQEANTGVQPNRVRAVFGLLSPGLQLTAVHFAQHSAASHQVGTGVGIDSTSVNSAQITVGYSVSTSGNMGIGILNTSQALGYHYYTWLEWTDVGTGTMTWYGDAGIAGFQCGLFGTLMG